MVPNGIEHPRTQLGSRRPGGNGEYEHIAVIAERDVFTFGDHRH